MGFPATAERTKIMIYYHVSYQTGELMFTSYPETLEPGKYAYINIEDHGLAQKLAIGWMMVRGKND
jgi:hypothetical protein